MPVDPFTLKEKVVLLKVALLEVEALMLNTSIPLEQRKHELRAIIADELNSPSQQDRDNLFQMRRAILKHRRS